MSGNGASSRGRVLVVGGGVAGLAATLALAREGVGVTLLERGARLGGRVLDSVSVFPSMEGGERVVQGLARGLEDCPGVQVLLGAELVLLRREAGGFEADVQMVGDGEDRDCLQRRAVRAEAIIVATGLEPVDAGLIPELGYPKLRNVVLSTEFDALLSKGELVRPSDGGRVSTVAFVQCVGSRVERRGVPYCSAVCCMNAIKNALLVKELDRSIEAYVLYIDVRMHGKGYEALYRRAREAGVRFVRGQPSMVVPKPASERVLVVGENTLLKELYEIPADLVVLSVGLRQRPENLELLQGLDVQLDKDGLAGREGEMEGVRTSASGVFLAGCVEAPKDVRDSIAQGEAAALAAMHHVRARTSS